MRLSISAVLSTFLLLAACSTPTTTQEQPPPADAPEGTESGGAVAGTSETASEHFGDSFTLKESIKATELLDNPEAFTSGPILVEGTVVDVCQKAGCWMVISDGSRQIRVTMKDHGFAVRKDGTGSWATIEGTLRAIQLDPERVAHLESESTRPDLLPEKSDQQYEIDATGVSFKGPGKDS